MASIKLLLDYQRYPGMESKYPKILILPDCTQKQAENLLEALDFIEAGCNNLYQEVWECSFPQERERND